MTGKIRCVQDDLFFLIDLSTMDRCTIQEEHQWRPDLPSDFFKGPVSYRQVRPEGRRYFSIEVDETKRPDDPVPTEAAQDKKHAVSIWDYSNSMFKSSRAGLDSVKDPNGYVVKAHKMLHRQKHMLAKAKLSEVKSFYGGKLSLGLSSAAERSR